MTTAIMSITAIGGSDGRRPLLMGAIAQAGVGYFYGHLDRWVALHDNRELGKPVRLREPKTDAFDDNGEITREGRVDVLGRIQDTKLALYYGSAIGRTIVSRDDVAHREEYDSRSPRLRTFCRSLPSDVSERARPGPPCRRDGPAAARGRSCHHGCQSGPLREAMTNFGYDRV